MTESWDELDDTTLLGVFMAFGGGLGGGAGYLIGFLLDNPLMLGPIGMSMGVSLGLGLWLVFSDGELG